jgi:hypothetical protein
MRTSYRWLALAALGSSFGAACGGGDGTGPGGGGGSAAFTAKIDGQDWASDAAGLRVQGGVSQIPGYIIITGTKVASTTSYTSLVLTLAYISGPGDYPLGVNPISTAGGIGQVVQGAGTVFESRATPFSGAAGTVTVTTLTSTRIAGTFNYVATPTLGSGLTSNRTVTNGSFDVALPAGFTSVPAGNHGNTFSATLGGTAWNGATIVGQGSGGSFGITAATDSFTVSLQPSVAVTAGNAYTIGTGAGKVTLSVVHNGGGARSWGGQAGDVGTVVVTSLANGRAAGTFSGTLAGNSGSLTFANGEFDVKLGP